MTACVSVVIPVFNEAGSIGPLLQRLAPVMDRLERPFEVLVVDDGSTDATAAEVARVAAVKPQVRGLCRPHAGQANALLTGLREARGEVIITLDGDGQNDPADIPVLFACVDSGQADLAQGWRTERQDDLLRRTMSRASNAVRRWVLQDQVHDAGCQLRVFRREVVAALQPMELMQSFIPALAVAAGFRIREFPVHHHARQHGHSNYGLRRLWWRPALAMVALRWTRWRERR